MIRHLAAAIAVLTLTATATQAGNRDPLSSLAWEDLRAEFLGDAPVVYDYMVRLIMPKTVEDAFSVPLVIKISDLIDPVVEIVVIAENNPIQAAVQIFPHHPMRAVGMNIRLEQSTPVRAAALDSNGVWHVASVRVKVNNPGGCSAPAAIVAGGDANPLGEIAMKRFKRADRQSRLKIGITHPMDTGFAPDAEGEIVPAYYVDTVTIADEAGPIAELVTWAALASNPSFFFDLPESQQSVRVTASDTRGLAFEGLDPAPSM
jgi:sulfur-oxidizing protein SoxY